MFKEMKKYIGKKEAGIILAGVALSILLYATSGETGTAVENGQVQRGDYGEDSETVSLIAEIEDAGSEELEIEVSSTRYTDDECETLYTECREQLLRTMLASNESLENITDDLDLLESLDGYPFTFSWRMQDKEILEDDGKLIAHEDGSSRLYLTASYGKWEKEESFEICYKAASSEETIKNDLEKAVEETEESTRTEDYLELPDEVDGRKVVYSTPQSKKEPLLLFLGPAAAFAVIAASCRDRKKAEEGRKERILSEYPTVIQKMVMYLAAGMNIRNVWIRIYEDSLEDGRENPLYEEMGITSRELKNGISEEKAYYDFSKRIKIPEITRFSTLLIQNMKKGSTNLKKLLEEEAREAFSERKRRAKIKGEEAGTKLLLPMMLLLVVVMVVIMIPAFWSM